MKILEVEVKWWKEYGNEPEFYVTVDELPTDLTYIHKEEIYFAEKDGYVDFLAETSNKNGFGGSVFNLNMADGSVKTLKGPWSSRASYCNSLGLTPCGEVVIKKSKYGFMSGNLTVPLLLQCAQKAGCYLVIKVFPQRMSNDLSGQQTLAVYGHGSSHQFNVTSENWQELCGRAVGSEFSFYPSVNPYKVEKP